MTYSYDRTASSKEFWKPVTDDTPKKIGITWVRPGNQRDGEAHAFREATFDDGSAVVDNESLCGKKFQGMAISKARAHGNTSSAQCPDCKKKSEHVHTAANIPNSAWDRTIDSIIQYGNDMKKQVERLGGIANALEQGHGQTLQGQLGELASVVRTLQRRLG